MRTENTFKSSEPAKLAANNTVKLKTARRETKLIIRCHVITIKANTVKAEVTMKNSECLQIQIAIAK